MELAPGASDGQRLKWLHNKLMREVKEKNLYSNKEILNCVEMVNIWNAFAKFKDFTAQ